MNLCRAEAVDKTTDRTVYCLLVKGHKHTHFWRQREGDEILSASWYGPDDGLPVVIGREAQNTGSEPE